MANYAKVEINLTGNSSVNDYLDLVVYGVPGGTFNMYEVARSNRLSSNQYSIGVDNYATALNLRDALLADYNSKPFTITRYQTVITITATIYGVSFGLASKPPASTVSITAEVLPTFLIDGFAYEAASAYSNLYFKCKFHLKTGYEGSAPYKIRIGGNQSISIPKVGEYLELQVERVTITKSSDQTFLLQDNAGQTITGNLPGMQNLTSDYTIEAEFINDDATNADVQLSVKLQVCNPEDKAIILEAKVQDSSGDTLIDWQVVSNEITNGSTTEINLGNVVMQNAVVAFRDNFSGVWGTISINSPIENDPVFIIPKSNSLRFINKTDEEGPNHYENRLIENFNFRNRFNKEVFQRFLKTSNLWAQYYTNYATVNAYLVDVLGVETPLTTIYNDVIYSSRGIKWFRVQPPIANKLGKYRLRIKASDPVFGSLEYNSDWFLVCESIPVYTVMNWSDDLDQYGYQDGVYWDQNQEMLINGEFVNIDPGTKKDILEDTNNRIVNLRSYPMMFDRLLIYEMNAPQMERFILAFQKYKVYLNGVQYQLEDKPEFTASEGSTNFKANLLLRRVNYEIY